jgi:hypothetical protein
LFWSEPERDDVQRVDGNLVIADCADNDETWTEWKGVMTLVTWGTDQNAKPSDEHEPGLGFESCS